MRGIIFAFLAGACITLQGVANARISQDIGTWQAATITQLTGFIMALAIALVVRDGKSTASARCIRYTSAGAVWPPS